MSVTDTWRPKRPGPASDRDNVTRQTLRWEIIVIIHIYIYIVHTYNMLYEMLRMICVSAGQQMVLS